MARKKRPPDPGPSNAYLLSFGDTMTTLLAFFIVLNSLAEEQTGANLYRGTGSFIQAIDSFGLPGNLPGDRSSNAVARNETSPLYIAPNTENDEYEKNASGPDEDDDGKRVINREADEFERFMNEMDRLFDVKELPSTKAEVVFDFFEKLPEEGPLTGGKYDKVVDQVLPVLHRKGYNVEVIVWATTPSNSAWERAVRQSEQFANELAQLANLAPNMRFRLSAIGQPWFDSKARRPVLSITVRKLDGGE
jgi:flagellar motor protein MotB